MLRRDTVTLHETSGSKHRSKHISLKSKGDVSVRANKYPVAMKSLGWNMRTSELPTAQVQRLWIFLPELPYLDAVATDSWELNLGHKKSFPDFSWCLRHRHRATSWPLKKRKEIPDVERYSLGCRAHLKSTCGQGAGCQHPVLDHPTPVPLTIFPRNLGRNLLVPLPIVYLRCNPAPGTVEVAKTYLF